MTTTLSTITLATRSSPLALAQVTEIQTALARHHPEIGWDLCLFTTVGDRDRTTSLRSLGATDFFTRELDTAVLEGRCRVALHAAKDLPYPLPEGLCCVALTSGIDSGDCVVTAQGRCLYDLPAGSSIATSSLRREAAVQALRPDLTFCDLRGTIHERLARLDEGDLGGIVVAEAALLRLGLSHLVRYRLPGRTALHQGRLALIARRDDDAIAALLACLNDPTPPRPYRQLQVGLNPLPASEDGVEVQHCPLISTTARPYDEASFKDYLHKLPRYTHLLFTSPRAVHHFISGLHHHGIDLETLRPKAFLTVGAATAAALQAYGCHNVTIAPEATAEGVCQMLSQLDLSQMYIGWSHAALARPVIANYLNTHRAVWQECILYDTTYEIPNPIPELPNYDEVLFTSPSTIEAFLELYGVLPIASLALCCQGPITRQHLRHRLISYRSLHIYAPASHN